MKLRIYRNLQTLKERPFTFFITGIMLFLLALMLMGPFFSRYSPMASHLEHALSAPSQMFFLGTDSNGRDILAQILYGARISLLISLTVVLNCLTIGILVGFFAGFYGGKVDRVFLFVADVFQAFPGILLAIFIAAFLKPSIMNLILLLSFVGWVSYARVVRAVVTEMKTREFILAAHALGASLPRLLSKHFLPNMLGPLVVQASFGMAGVILAESTLSFLGLGLPENVPSLGKLMDNGVNLLLVAPHVALFPGLVIMLFVLFFNLTGDWLREKFG